MGYKSINVHNLISGTKKLKTAVKKRCGIQEKRTEKPFIIKENSEIETLIENCKNPRSSS